MVLLLLDFLISMATDVTNSVYLMWVLGDFEYVLLKPLLYDHLRPIQLYISSYSLGLECFVTTNGDTVSSIYCLIVGLLFISQSLSLLRYTLIPFIKHYFTNPLFSVTKSKSTISVSGTFKCIYFCHHYPFLQFSFEQVMLNAHRTLLVLVCLECYLLVHA